MYWKALAVSAISAAVAVGCASTPPPQDALSEAEEAISQAKARDAAQYAPLALRKAEDKFKEAREAARDDDHYAEARRLAEQAQVDAQLALAEAERAKAEAELEELSRTVRAVEEEIQHESR